MLSASGVDADDVIGLGVNFSDGCGGDLEIHTTIDAAIRIGDRVDTGTWFLNPCDYLDPALAWTGVKNSGRGCSLSRLGYESMTRPKSFHLRFAP